MNKKGCCKIEAIEKMRQLASHNALFDGQISDFV
jgi:hypothetical protein